MLTYCQNIFYNEYFLPFHRQIPIKKLDQRDFSTPQFRRICIGYPTYRPLFTEISVGHCLEGQPRSGVLSKDSTGPMPKCLTEKSLDISTDLLISIPLLLFTLPVHHSFILFFKGLNRPFFYFKLKKSSRLISRLAHIRCTVCIFQFSILRHLYIW